MKYFKIFFIFFTFHGTTLAATQQQTVDCSDYAFGYYPNRGLADNYAHNRTGPGLAPKFKSVSNGFTDLKKTDSAANAAASNAAQLNGSRQRGLKDNAELTSAQQTALGGENQLRAEYCYTCREISKKLNEIESGLNSNCAHNSNDVQSIRKLIKKYRKQHSNNCLNKSPYDKLCAGSQ
jgi:hypothetical protein